MVSAIHGLGKPLHLDSIYILLIKSKSWVPLFCRNTSDTEAAQLLNFSTNCWYMYCSGVQLNDVDRVFYGLIVVENLYSFHGVGGQVIVLDHLWSICVCWKWCWNWCLSAGSFSGIGFWPWIVFGQAKNCFEWVPSLLLWSGEHEPSSS